MELSAAQRALHAAIVDRSILQPAPHRESPASTHAGAA
jgi:hypothetical protein